MEFKEMRWQGYARKDGGIGIRNKVLVIYTVECAAFVAKQIVSQVGHSEVEVVGFEGCTDNDYAVRLLLSLIRHPNIGGVLAVGLGCEYVQPERLAKKAAEAGKEADWFFIQDVGGTKKSIERGVDSVRTMQKALEQIPRVPMGFADLVIGAECGGSDFTSGLAGNVAVGSFYDLLVDCGGTAIFEEIVEAVGLEKQLAARGVDDRAKEEISSTYQKAMDYCKSVRQYSVSPGNFAGGLSTIEEKSMGALIKSGSRPIQGVLKVGGRPPQPGLWLLDSTPDPHWMEFGITNPNDNEGLMALISCGCQLVFLVTGRGNVVGSAVAPVLKITGNSKTFAHMREDMDFDAGLVLSGMCTREEIALRLAEMVAENASGNQTKSEALGHKEYFIPYKYQEKAVIKRCEQ
ncbi:MAG: D-galactarate dehydratase [Ruminococcaceae bacterium]|jgi:altronate hydrolase|nr:D-galactarate dehydratase [Oscillospiraceae bacterium]